MMDWLPVAGDALIAGSAATGAVVAVLGLKAWKAQLRGREDHDLARRLLVSVFQYRDSIRGVRNPGMFAHEIPAPPQEKAKDMSAEQRHHYGLTKAYERRLVPVTESRKKLYTDLLEADALWDKSVSEFFGVLFKLERELVRNVRNELRAQDPNVSQKTRDAYHDILRKHREVLYEGDADDDDEFQKEFNDGVAAIEEHLKTKLVKTAA